MSKVGPEQRVHLSTEELLNVTLLGSEWTSSAGGLSTFNRELAIHLTQHPKVQVSFLVPEGACIYEDKLEAQSYGITVVDAKKRLGFEPLDWLSFPPEHLKMDVVVGHGVKLGRQGQVIREKRNFKWVQVVHTAPEDLSRYKRYPNPISKGERKHEVEVGLCKLADLVVPVGPKLEEAYSSYLRRRKKEQAVFSITPGLFDREFGDLEQDPNENGEFKVLLCGRGDDEDFELKGYNVAAEAFTDHRLKRKPYQLIFVGAPDQKHEEVTAMLVQCGIDKDQLTVRKFLKSREDMKDLLCEVDLAIMPSKSEGFGLIALEALSAGLPILVGRKSGFARALKNFPLGKSCIVDSDDPTEWAEAIEGVRLRHGVRLEEMKALRASYDKRYSWKEQCEALVEKMWRMVREESAAKSLKAVCEPHLKRSVSETNEGAIASSKGLYTKRSRSISEFPFSQGPSRVSGKTSNVEFLFEEQSSADTPDEAGAPNLGYQPLLPEEKKTFGIEEDGPSFSDAKSLQTVSNQETPGSTSDTGTETITLQLKITPEELNDEQQEIFDSVIQQTVLSMEPDNLSTNEGVGSLTKYLKESHSITLKTFTSDGLTIIVQCPLESLERLLDDYHSGHLNEVAERCLLAGEIRTILDMDTVRLKTTIEEELSNVEMLKDVPLQTEPDQDASKRWAETGGVGSNPGSPSQKPEQHHGAGARWTEPSQGRTASPFPKREPEHKTNTSWTNTSSQIQMGKMKETSCTMRAERAKASRTALHKASISGQYETGKMLLDSGEDVDQRDQFSLTPLHLACWYGQESVVRLLLEHGANVNALDRFQRTPLQKAERHNHQSIVQLLLKNNAKPSCRQPLSLKRLSQKSFLQVDRRSGLNLLQAAVFEGNSDIAFKAHALLDNLVKEMNSKIGSDTQLFPGKSAVDILSSLEKKRPRHAEIDKDYQEDVEKYKTLTELHHCARSGDAEMAVELVLNDGVDADIPALCNRTPLLWASLSSPSTMIKTLIDLGADVNAQRSDDKVEPLGLATDWNNYMATRLLLEHGADINLRDKYGTSAIYAAVCNNHENLVKLLLENKADVSIQDSKGDSLLHLSISRGLFKLTQLLIEAGCNVNLRNKRGRTPLYIAVKKENEEIVKLLLGYNADVGMEYKQNPEERIYLVRAKDGGKPSWHYVLVERHFLGLFLKRTNGGSLDVKDFGEVFESGWGKNPPENTINNILPTRVDILQEIPGETLLHVASRNNSVNIIDLLVKKGAWYVNAGDKQGYTPLHEAVIRGNMQAVKKLVDLEADVNQAVAIVDMAHMNEETEIEEYLKSMIVPTGKEVGRDISLANSSAEASSFELINPERLRLIGNTIQRGYQLLEAVFAHAIRP